ncbi:MAG: protein kinase [Sandaracinus sp.]|nr:protein kinase [Sandaracinus sp.]MCB9618392.1 protein kinase [Sandaracinus sp.]MCB9623079.1 protein kinase [Sandaracinus sp.]
MSHGLAPELRNLAGRQLGRYEVLTQLASGGMAAVYVARAKGVAGFERLVAVKVLHPHLAYEEEFISMFLDEARLAARIRHPNVVGTLDISDTEGDGFFLVMEYIEGDHLGALLAAAARAGERLDTSIVSRIVLDALHGLSAAHDLIDEEGDRLELVHRDISPHNVMVGVDGIGRLTDFGVAKAEKRLTSTRAGHFKGKLAYMAPEQASTGHADQRSDLFAMGILLWESLTGRRLFRADNNAATLTKILQDPIPNVSDLVPDLAPFDEVLSRALARDPEARFQSAEEFAEALERVARDNGGIGSARGVGSEVRKWLAEKLETQRGRIKEAMTHLGHADVTETALPVPRDGSLSSISRSGPRPVGAVSPEAATATGSLASARSPLGVPLAPLPSEPPRNRRVQIAAVAAAVALLALGGTLAVVLSGSSTGTATPLPPAAAAPQSGHTTEVPSVDPVPAVAEANAPSEPVTGVATPVDVGQEPAAQPAAEARPEARTTEATERTTAEASTRRSTRRRDREAQQASAEEPTMAPVARTPEPEPARMDPEPEVRPEPRPTRMAPTPTTQEPIFNPYRQ